MQYEAETPEEYLGQLNNDWRKEKLSEVRDMIRSSGKELEEGIEYKMLCYGINGKNIFHLNAQVAYVSLYVGSIKKIEKLERLLKDFDKGKGCIRIKKSVDLSKTGLEEFISNAIDFWRQGGDMDC